MPNGPESQISIYNIFSKSEVSVIEKVSNVKSVNIINDISLETTIKEPENKSYETNTDKKIDYLNLKEMHCYNRNKVFA